MSLKHGNHCRGNKIMTAKVNKTVEIIDNAKK